MVERADLSGGRGRARGLLWWWGRMRFRSVVAAMLSVGAVACGTTSVVRTDQLQRLDGYGTGGPNVPATEIETISGSKVAVGPETVLMLELPGARIGGQFAEIHVQDGVLSGRLKGGFVVDTPLSQINKVTVEGPSSGGKTALIVAGAVLGALLIGLVVIYGTVQSQTVSGRPLRIRGAVVRADLAAVAGWQAAGPGPDVRALSPAARRALAAAWADAARSEHASVPAFARLALTLVSLGAPSRLVEAVHRAALEEIEHARITFALVEAYAYAPVSPGSLEDLWAAPAVTARSLPELARESLIDGCLNEGIAAEVARQACARAGDPVVRAALATIARDEASHAELAWQIVEWCCVHGGAEMGRDLRKLVHGARLPAAPDAVPERLRRELDAHGWLDSAAWNEIGERTRLTVASRLASMQPRLACARS